MGEGSGVSTSLSHSGFRNGDIFVRVDIRQPIVVASRGCQPSIGGHLPARQHGGCVIVVGNEHRRRGSVIEANKQVTLGRVTPGEER